MATGFFHHIGSFLLFAAVILLIVTCITAPAVHDLAILKVTLSNSGGSDHPKVNFGTFGYCITGQANDETFCQRSVGYSPASVMNLVENTEFSDYAVRTTDALTKVMILHPIAAGLAFIAFLLAVGSGIVGSFLAALVSLLTLVVTVIVLVCDFVLFSIIKSNVNDDGSGSEAEYSVGIWTMLVAAIFSLLGAIIVFLTCCSSRLHRDRTTTKVDGGYAAPGRRRRRWL